MNVRAATGQVNISGKSSSLHRQPEATRLRLRRGPECNAMDPFYTLPISEAGQTQFLTYHCESPLSCFDLTPLGSGSITVVPAR